VVTLYITTFNTQRFYTLPIQYIYVVCTDPGNKQRYSPCTELTDWFLGAFSNLRKADINFFISVCPSVLLPVHVLQLGSCWKDFHEV